MQVHRGQRRADGLVEVARGHRAEARVEAQVLGGGEVVPEYCGRKKASWARDAGGWRVSVEERALN